MCGISLFFARESVPDLNIIDKFLSWSEKRGQDGFGYCICNKKNVKIVKRYTDKYSNNKYEILKDIFDNLKVGDILLSNARMSPETESITTSQNITKTMQPIINNDIILVHNGSVTNEARQRFSDQYKFTTDIDSESIIASYIINNKNIKKTVEDISGGFASIMFDSTQNRIYYWRDHMPLSVGYVRGVGFFLSSFNECLTELVHDISHVCRNGENCWEDFYNHPIPAHIIHSIDLDSGFIRQHPYVPKYIAPGFISNKLPTTLNVNKELCLVCCSGGLDSTATLSMLKKAGYDNIIACHFNYGHRGGKAEQFAIEKITKKLDIELKIFDLTTIYKHIPKETSMLLDEESEITTQTSNDIKSTVAWVPGRNMMFMTTLATFAEGQVLKHDYQNVYILGGMLNLTEESVYADNSKEFIDSFLYMCKFGTLIGDRIKPLYGLCDLSKAEQICLLKNFDLMDVYSNTISCDRPIIDECDNSYNCWCDNMPACGSGLLSYFAMHLNDLDDKYYRKYYNVEDNKQPLIPSYMKNNEKRKFDVYSIINRIHFPEDKLLNLKKILNTK